MIKTGKTPISVMTFCAIMAISLVVNLPGLAVTPMLGTLSKVFPDTTQLEKQLLTVLPNLLIIPFVLLSGKLSLTKHKIAIVVAGLVVYTACAIAYLFAKSMLELIVYSCFLGCGAGLLIPFSTGLIADVFYGKIRMKEMGLQSGISNAALVMATFAVGWLSHSNWHLPFAVYLIALLPLVLALWLKGIPAADLAGNMATTQTQAQPAQRAQATAGKTPASPQTDPDNPAPAPFSAGPGEKVVNGFYVNRIWALVAVYAFITFGVMTITYYCPFLIEKKDWSASLTGTITAIFFLFILIPGFTITWFVKIMKNATFFICGILMTGGLALFAFVPVSWAMCVGAALAGLGYGICQPLIYDKASRAVVSDSKSTLSLAFVLSADYIAVVLTPFIIDGLRDLFHVHQNGTFAFIVCFVLLAAYTFIVYRFRNRFAFSVNKNYY